MKNNFVSVYIENAVFRKALMRYHRIRDCSVRINRCNMSKIPIKSTNKELRAVPNKNIYSNIAWLPSSTHRSDGMLSALASYQMQNSVVPSVSIKKRQFRNKTVFVKPTPGDLESEFLEKINLPNKGLKPVSHRQLSAPKEQPLSIWEKMVIEFKAKIKTKKLITEPK